MTLDETKSYLGLRHDDRIWNDPAVVRMTIPRAGFGQADCWYPAEMVNTGKGVEVKVAGKKVGDLSPRTLADAVDVFRATGSNRVTVALEGQRADKATQAVIAKAAPSNT